MTRLSAVVLCTVVFTAYATISPYLAILVRSMGFSQALTGLLLGAVEISAIAAPSCSARGRTNTLITRPRS
ncbi:MAG: hypothetical protein LBG27_08605 [Spirochaetaceae bacterium]|nr:hypothetical protein [Spirochaetaceae bacterium]